MSVLDVFSLKDKVIVITGGAGLLGAEYALTIAEAGGIPVIADINEDGAVKVASEVSVKTGNKTLGLHVDITDKDSVNALVKQVLQQLGRVDSLVNNAALDPKFDQGARKNETPSGAFEDFPLAVWNEAIRVNLTGMFLMTQACIVPMLKQGKKGSIVNICSTYGLNGPDQRIYIKKGRRASYKPVYYSVTKAGVLGFTKYLASYYAGTEIRVNALTPGGVFTNHDDTFVKNYSTKTILGRMAKKNELNGALLFLVSDASSYMTGSNVVVDGGWTAW